jgi:hypothetical protein
MSYLRLQKGWRERLAKEARCLVVQVETEVVVPVELASNIREHATRTLRPRMREHLDDFLVELELTALDKPFLDIETSGLDLSDIGAILDGMELDRIVPPVSHFYRGGTSEAKRILPADLSVGGELLLDRAAGLSLRCVPLHLVALPEHLLGHCPLLHWWFRRGQCCSGFAWLRCDLSF